MRNFNYYALSSICALIIGVLLVVWPGEAVRYLVITIGVLFLLPGLIGVFGYLATAKRREEAGIRSVFPVAAVGSALLGFWLMIMPDFFITTLMYVLGVLLVLAGLSQLFNFISVRNFTKVPFLMYVVPVLVLLAGIVVLANPFQAATLPFTILGVSAIVYSLTDLIRLIRFRKKVMKEEENIVDVTPIEEIKDEQ